MTDRTNEVTVLITAEAIIAGFRISYATLVSQMLTYWSEHGGSLFTTFQAGLLASAVVLTCFRSIFVLYRSISPKSTKANTTDYEEGYAMFVAAILLSGIYVVLDVLSIYHFALRLKPIAPLSDFALSFAELAVFFSYVLILLHKPMWIVSLVECLSQGRGRKIAEILGWAGVALLVVAFLLYWI